MERVVRDETGGIRSHRSCEILQDHLKTFRIKGGGKLLKAGDMIRFTCYLIYLILTSFLDRKCIHLVKFKIYKECIVGLSLIPIPQSPAFSSQCICPVVVAFIHEIQFVHIFPFSFFI